MQRHLGMYLSPRSLRMRQCRLVHTRYIDHGMKACKLVGHGRQPKSRQSTDLHCTSNSSAIAGQWPATIPGQASQTCPHPGLDNTEAWPCTKQVLDDFVGMFNTMPYEYDYWIDKAWVTGTIPKELQGTYLRNGPALQSSSGHQKRHFLDADGCVLSLAFPGNGAMPRFTNKYVRTKGFLDEQAAGKPVHRNAFTRGSPDGSLLFNPFNLSFKNVANTNVLYWADKVWALWEVGRPYELCPRTLNTIGESDMGGQVGARIAGHYKTLVEPDGSQRLLLFGTEVEFTGMQLAFYEMDEQGKVIAQAKHQLQGIGFDIMFVHDMMVTEHWYCVVMGPVQLDVKAFLTDYMLGKKSLGELLIYNTDKPSKIFLFPRPGKTPPPAAGTATHYVLEAPPFFTFHHVNAYECKGGSQIVMDTISWQDIAFSVSQHTITADYYIDGCRTHLYKLVADLPSSSIVSCQQQVRKTLEFPTFNLSRTGKSYRHAYFAGDAVDHQRDWAPAQAVVRVTYPEIELSGKHSHHDIKKEASNVRCENILPCSLTEPGSSQSANQPSLSSRAYMASQAQGVVCEEWRPGQRKFPGEPMFIPRPGSTVEDDGWIIVGIHEAETQKGEIAILDAQRISDGPVAIIHLPHQLPYGLHGTWSNVYLGPDVADPSVPVWRTPNKVREV